jgi:hypothetical protein
MISAANLGQECLLINQEKDEEIIDDSDHDSENVANILLDLSTSEIPVMKIEKGINIYTGSYTYETL